jgi:hypothetical protein
VDLAITLCFHVAFIVFLSSIIYKHIQVFCGQVEIAFTMNSTTGSPVDTCNGCM